MMNFFARKIIVPVKYIKNLTTNAAELPFSFTVITWPPGLKQIDKNDDVISITPLSSREAKIKRTERAEGNLSGRNIEMQGHASARFSIDLFHPNLTRSCKNCIYDFLAENDIEYESIQKVESYISWFPKTTDGAKVLTGRKLDFAQHIVNMLGTDAASIVFPKESPKVNSVFSTFFGAEYQARNSDYSADIELYGKPAEERIIDLSGDLDYQNIFLLLANMMQPSVSKEGNILLLNKTMPNATYFGADILVKYLRYFGNSNNYEFKEITKIINPAHICTTSVLHLIEAGIGEEVCKENAEKVISENNLLQITGGLPLVDFTHHFAKCIEKRLIQHNAPSPPKLS